MPNLPNDRSDLVQRLADEQREMIERYRLFWESTRNPVFVWKAVESAFYASAWEDAAETGARPKPPFGAAVLPPWCLEYLSQVAARIGWMADGRDFADLPPALGGKAEYGTAKDSLPGNPKMSPKNAAAALAPALEMTNSKGMNAFRAYWKLELARMDDLSIASIRAGGRSAEEAAAIVAEENCLTDHRTIEKRVADLWRASGQKKPERSPP